MDLTVSSLKVPKQGGVFYYNRRFLPLIVESVLSVYFSISLVPFRNPSFFDGIVTQFYRDTVKQRVNGKE